MIEDLIAQFIVICEVRSKEQMVQSGPISLAYELKDIMCSVHQNLISLPE